MIDDKVLIGNIQRFCVHDGDGIRTTVFLKGCDIRCPWCANPENQKTCIQKFIDDGVEKQYGKMMSQEEIIDIILRDKIYYENGGGVTYSGGEPLLNLNIIENVLKELKSEGISQWIETSLFAPTDYVLFAMNYMDNFIIDLKNICREQCKKYLSGDSDLYLKNFDIVVSKYKNAVVRIPVVEPYTYNSENIYKIIQLLKRYKDIRIQLFKVHNLGMSKYKNLNMEYSCFEEISDNDLVLLYNQLKAINDRVEIISL